MCTRRKCLWKFAFHRSQINSKINRWKKWETEPRVILQIRATFRSRQARANWSGIVLPTRGGSKKIAVQTWNCTMTANGFSYPNSRDCCCCCYCCCCYYYCHNLFLVSVTRAQIKRKVVCVVSLSSWTLTCSNQESRTIENGLANGDTRLAARKRRFRPIHIIIMCVCLLCEYMRNCWKSFVGAYRR